MPVTFSSLAASRFLCGRPDSNLRRPDDLPLDVTRRDLLPLGDVARADPLPCARVAVTEGEELEPGAMEALSRAHRKAPRSLRASKNLTLDRFSAPCAAGESPHVADFRADTFAGALNAYESKPEQVVSKLVVFNMIDQPSARSDSCTGPLCKEDAPTAAAPAFVVRTLATLRSRRPRYCDRGTTVAIAAKYSGY